MRLVVQFHPGGFYWRNTVEKYLKNKTIFVQKEINVSKSCQCGRCANLEEELNRYKDLVESLKIELEATMGVLSKDVNSDGKKD